MPPGLTELQILLEVAIVMISVWPPSFASRTHQIPSLLKSTATIVYARTVHMSQNSSSYRAYTHDTKTGTPPPRFSLAIGEPLGSDPKPRGVERLPVSAHDSSEETINALIVEKIADLAKDTKRVYGVPKRL